MNESFSRVAGGLLGLHVLTSMHPGSGTALGTVDLPVQRERHTHWPNIAGSALKGVLRDAARERIIQSKGLQDEADAGDGDNRKTKRDYANEDAELVDIFGPSGSDTARAGALCVTDGRIAVYPVRSLRGVYALVTCPAVLERIERDASAAGLAPPAWTIPQPATGAAVVCSDCACLVEENHLVLEEFEFTKAEGEAGEIAGWMAERLAPSTEAFASTRSRFSQRFAVLHDDDFTHFVEHATEVVARVGLNYETKTVKEGALFYQEFLPPESLFYAVLLANPVRDRFGEARRGAGDVLQAMQQYIENTPTLQIGGDETTGKGFCATRFFCA